MCIRDSWWSAASAEPGQWLCVDLGKDSDVRAIQVSMADEKLVVDFPADSYGDDRLGKAIGGDILEGKKTYLMVMALSKASAAEHRILASTYSDPTLSDQQKIARVREVFDKLGVARLTEQQINHRFERALNILDTLSVQSEGTARLREYAGSLIGRNK